MRFSIRISYPNGKSLIPKVVVKEGSSISGTNGGRFLNLQHVPVLGVGPGVEPQDAVLHHGRVRRRARPAVLVHLAKGSKLLVS